MSRSRIVTISALTALALVVLFAVFIWFRHDAALIGALSAAGTVAAGGFAAIAAVGAMRAASESSATARRSREAFARSVRPRIRPEMRPDGNRLLGAVQCGEGHAAVDVTVAWILSGHDTVVDQVARLEPWRPDLPPGSDNESVVDLGLPASAKVEEAIGMVWFEYWDERRVGHWRDTWRVGTAFHGSGRLLEADSELVD